MGGQGTNGERLAQALEGPGARGGEGTARVLGERLLDVLRLAAFAVGRDDDPAGDARGEVRAVVQAQDVQAQVQA